MKKITTPYYCPGCRHKNIKYVHVIEYEMGFKLYDYSYFYCDKCGEEYDTIDELYKLEDNVCIHDLC